MEKIEISKEFLKTQIENLKESIKHERELDKTGLFNDDVVTSWFAGAHNVAYELLQIMYEKEFKTMSDDFEEAVFNAFCDYLYSDKITLDEYLRVWFEEKA